MAKDYPRRSRRAIQLPYGPKGTTATSITSAILPTWLYGLLECHRILKDTGSLYLHCDPTMSHYLKILLDCVFGEKNFRNEIVWHYELGMKAKARKFHNKHDILFFYVKGSRFFFNRIYEKYKAPKKQPKLKFDSKTKKAYQLKSDDGKPLYILLTEKLIGSIWAIQNIPPASKERIGYPTQKPLALLERIIQASSKKGDLVLDPFCGCATTCIAAEKLGRKWVGIDISIKAYDLVQERLKKEVANPEELFDYKKALNFSIKPPKRTDLRQTDIDQKYVYVISNKAYKNEYKVGIAKDIQKRLNSYQTSDPNRGYKLEHKKLTPRYRELEKYIHRELQSRHEWVKADLETIKKTMKDFDKS